jgi:hypothetical protein
VSSDAEAATLLAVVGRDVGKDDVGQVRGDGCGRGEARERRRALQQVHSPAPFTQESPVIFVDVIKYVRSISRTLVGVEWPSRRVSTLMAILKGGFIVPLLYRSAMA